MVNINESLKTLTLRMNTFTPQMQDLAKQALRKTELKKKGLEKEFKIFVQDLQQFDNDTIEFWNNTRTQIRAFSNKDMSENSFLIKNLNLEARKLTRQIEEFNSVFRYLNQKFNKLPAELNWWTLEACALDFDKLCNKMLFLARELAKNIETYNKTK